MALGCYNHLTPNCRWWLAKPPRAVGELEKPRYPIASRRHIAAIGRKTSTPNGLRCGVCGRYFAPIYSDGACILSAIPYYGVYQRWCRFSYYKRQVRGG